MHAHDIAEIYLDLDRREIPIWIDGGWAIDAVLGRETRPHDDLDIAIEAKCVDALRQRLAQLGYREAPRDDDSEWNFALRDNAGRQVDVHVVVLDERDGVLAPPLAGIAYPARSLTGVGVIAGVPVRCVHADFLLQFKTSYPPRPKDREDIAALCALLGRPVPDAYK